MKKIIIDNLDALQRVAAEFVQHTAGKRIFAIYGSMGAGKTTLIKSICAELGSIETVTSPTFTLVNEYTDGSGEKIYHFDFYRINKIEEIFDFGFEEYIDSGSYCFMEWPELIEEALPEETVRVKISVADDLSRILEIDINP